MAETGLMASDEAATGAGAARRRMSAVTIDNVIFSVSSLVVFLWAAKALEPVDFGRFALILLTYVFVQGSVVRSLVSWTVMVHPEDADGRPRAVLGSALILSLGAGLLCVVAGAALMIGDAGMGRSMILVGLLLPLLAVEEVGRFIAFAQARPGKAIVLDVLWLVLTVVALVAIPLFTDLNLMWMVVAWGGTGALAGVWVFVQQGFPRGHDISLRWLKERWHFSWRSLVAASSSATVALFGAGLVAVVSGPLAVAAVRAALLLERPSTTVQMAVATSAGAEIARERSDNSGLLVHQRRAMVVSVAVAAVNFVVLFLIPEKVGKLILGDVWPLVTPLLLVIGLRVLAMAMQSGVRAALMGRKQISQVMKIDIAGTVLSIVGFVIGAALGDAEGAMWGSLIGLSLTVAGWWWALMSHLRSGWTYPDAESEASDDGAEDLSIEEIEAIAERPVS
jgi:O-antigen/teichoic acid export membrane protein